jgi:hypothetical protein
MAVKFFIPVQLHEPFDDKNPGSYQELPETGI